VIIGIDLGATNSAVDTAAGAGILVSLQTVITETGVPELWRVARDHRRWKLPFNLRAVPVIP
jgi:hypothetical protein